MEIRLQGWLYIIFVIILTLQQYVLSQDVVYYIDEQLPNSSYIGNVGETSNLFQSRGSSGASSLSFTFLTTDNEYAVYFRIEENTSKLYTNGVLDREAIPKCQYSATCVLPIKVAANSMLDSFFSVLNIDVHLNDINDHPPDFNKSALHLSIIESTSVGETFAIGGAIDKDTSPQFALKSYELQSKGLPSGEKLPFSISYVTRLGRISPVTLKLTGALDREIRSSYRMDLIAKDGDTPPRTTKLDVVVTVADKNDNPPAFGVQTFNVTVKEETSVGSSIITLNATDPDQGENGKVKYRLSEHQAQNIFKYFSINENTGDLLLKSQIVYSPGLVFRVIVEAFDNPVEGSSLSTQALVVVTVENSGNNAPIININLLSGTDKAVVSETAPNGTVVAFVEVRDHDVGQEGNTGCIIQSIDFRLEQLFAGQYKVVLAQKLDFETNPHQVVTIHCQDNGSPALQTSASFQVEVTDENDHPPVFMKIQYSENVAEDTSVGTTILTVSTTDIDTGINAQIKHFTVASKYRDTFYIQVSSLDPKMGYLRLNKSLDRELKSSYEFLIRAIDYGTPPATGTARVTLTITDVNDEAPEFTQNPFKFTVPENVPADTEVGRVMAVDADLGINAQVYYEIDPEQKDKVPFVVFPNGIVKTNQELNREAQDHYGFNVIVHDKGANPKSSTGSVEVTVSDENDMDPEIQFPHDGNNTILLSPNTMAWATICRVIAFDRDKPDTANSNLHYSINRQNSSNLFQINPNSGEIQITRNLGQSDVSKVYKLDLLVSDFGKPTERAVMAELIIRITYDTKLNISIPGVVPVPGAGSGKKPDSEEDTLSNQNFLIAVIVGVVTVVLAVGILATICIIRKIDRQRKEERNRNNADSDSEPKQVFDGSITVFSLPSEDSLLEKKKKEVSFSLEEDVFSDDDLIQKSGMDGHHRLYKPQLYLSPGTTGPKKVEDNHSETSGDTGTSDSGRGGSDEEIHSSFSQCHSPRDKAMEMPPRQIPPLPPHQEIIPFSFKKGLSIPIHSDFDRPSLFHSDGHTRNRTDRDMSRCDHNKYRTPSNDIEMSRYDIDKRRTGPNDSEMSRYDLDKRRIGSNGMSSMAVHYHNDSLDRSRNKVVLLQTDSGIHSDTNSTEGETTRDCMV